MKYKVIKIGEEKSEVVALFCNAGLGNLINFTPVVSFVSEEHVCDIYVVNNQVPDAPSIFAGFRNIRNIYTCMANDIPGIDVSKYKFIVSSRFFDPKMFKHKLSFGGNIKHNLHEAFDNFKAAIEAYNVVYYKEVNSMPPAEIAHNIDTDIKLPDKCIGIHSGWGGNREVWEKKSYKKWGKVAKSLWDRGYKTVTFGTEPDRRGWEGNKNNIDLIGKLSIPELGPVMKQLVGFASANSGLSHYAAAVGLKTVVLFGPTRDEEDKPFSNRAKIIRTKQCKHAPCKYTDKWEECKRYRCMFFNPKKVAEEIIEHVGEKNNAVSIPRISNAINNIVHFDDIECWVDIGTGNGKVVNSIKWNRKDIKKYMVEEGGVGNILNDEWGKIKFDDVEDFIKNNQVDLVTMFDVIEHFNKNNGVEFLNKISEHTKHIIIFTPYGFYQQDMETNPDECSENPLMEHKSGWAPCDLEDLGFKTCVLEKFHYHPYHKKYFGAIIAYK